MPCRAGGRLSLVDLHVSLNRRYGDIVGNVGGIIRSGKAIIGGGVDGGVVKESVEGIRASGAKASLKKSTS